MIATSFLFYLLSDLFSFIIGFVIFSNLVCLSTFNPMACGLADSKNVSVAHVYPKINSENCIKIVQRFMTHTYKHEHISINLT